MEFLSKSVLVTIIVLWCFTSSAFTEELNHVTQAPSSASAPAPYHNGHHHPHPPHGHHHPHPCHGHHHPHPPYGHHQPHPPHGHHPHPHPHPHSHPHPHPHPPDKAPVKPPTEATVYPPKFNMSLISVRGHVYCKSCKYAAYDTVIGGIPIQGAVVRLLCKGKKNIVAETTTDKNGYFLLLGPKTVTKFGFRGCRAYLVKAKDAKCRKVSKLNGGDVGAVLKPVRANKKSSVIVNKLTYGLFDVGPFAFEPVCPK